METAKLFANGGSQAVRLPKNCRFDGEEVLVNRIGSVVLLLPKDDPWGAMMTGLALFTDDYMNEPPDDPVPEERVGL